MNAFWVADGSGSISRSAAISGTVLGHDLSGYSVLISGVADFLNLGAAAAGIAVGNTITIPQAGLVAAP